MSLIGVHLTILFVCIALYVCVYAYYVHKFIISGTIYRYSKCLGVATPNIPFITYKINGVCDTKSK